MNIKGEWGVVTGGDSGIGLAFCRELASRGCNLLMVSIRDEELKEAAARLCRKYSVQTLSLTLDLTDPASYTALTQFLDQQHIVPLIMINNAGIFAFREVTEMTRRSINAFISLHVAAVTELSRLVGKLMSEHGRGYILNMSSMSCWTPMPGIALYSATKAYIRVFSRALHYELRDSGVRVMVACPGGIATNLFGLPERLKKLAVRIGALATSERFAHKAVVRLLRGRMQYINGLLNRMGILTVGIAPTCLRMQVKRCMLDRGIRR